MKNSNFTKFGQGSTVFLNSGTHYLVFEHSLEKSYESKRQKLYSRVARITKKVITITAPTKQKMINTIRILNAMVD